MSQTLVTTGGTIIAQLPPGPANIVVSNAGGTTVFIAAGGTSVTTGNGMPVVAGGILPLVFPGPAAGGAPLYAVAAAGSVSVGVLISAAGGNLSQPGTQ